MGTRDRRGVKLKQDINEYLAVDVNLLKYADFVSHHWQLLS